jgi:hypothetical protein
VFHLPGTCMQMSAYNHLHHYALQLPQPPTWVGFIDIDEFIVLRGAAANAGLAEWLKTWDKDPIGAIGLNWVLFGANGHDTMDPLNPSVLHRFTRRQIGVNRHIKSIVRLACLKTMLTPHHPSFISETTIAIDPEGTPIPENGPYHPDGNDQVACLFHYFTKSAEEFQKKCMRGRADIPVFRDATADFIAHNFNDIEDRSALDFWYKN